MRALTERAASACENAKHSRCRCRCGGALHGASRGTPVVELPPDDPHHAERSAAEQQRSFLEVFDNADVLEGLDERLAVGPRPPEAW